MLREELRMARAVEVGLPYPQKLKGLNTGSYFSQNMKKMKDELSILSHQCSTIQHEIRASQHKYVLKLDEEANDILQLQAKHAATDIACAPMTEEHSKTKAENDLGAAKLRDFDAAVMKYGCELQLIECETRRLHSRIELD